MNIKRELIALGIRVLADKTNVIAQPDPFTDLFTTFFGGETREQRLARMIEADLDKAVAAAKSARTNVKFKKIVKNY